MHLTTVYIHPTPREGRGRIPIYLPEQERGAPVVISLKLPNNEGWSVNTPAQQIAAEVIRYHSPSLPAVWIQHHPYEAADGASETFELVGFLSYEVMPGSHSTVRPPRC